MTGPIKIITSLQNDEVKNLVKLRQRRQRERQQVAILDEPLIIDRALAAGCPLQTVYFCLSCLSDYAQSVLDRLQALPDETAPRFIEVTKPVLAKIAYRDDADGLMAVVPQVHRSLNDLPNIIGGNRSALLVVLEAVEKPGNLGAVLRVADGAGADAVLVCGGGTDLYNPNVLRASRGACFTVPTLTAETPDVLAILADLGVQTLATTPAADHSWHDTNLSQPVAIVLGTEHDGLSDHWLNAANKQISLPMAGSGDSLNVSTTAAILLYEAVRQRQSESDPR